MESRRKYINVQGKDYVLLGMYGGHTTLGNVLDVNNEVVRRGIIWEMQPFFYDYNISKLKKVYYSTVRFFKKDCFGSSDFTKLCKKYFN